MSETVWISKAPLDSRLLLPLTSDVAEPKGLIHYWKANSAAESRNASCPTEIWVKDGSAREINKLPDLSLIRTSWILSQRLADVFQRFDLGKGGIEPVRAFKSDHHTPLAGQYFCLSFDNVKRAFLPDESSKVSNFVKGVWTTDPDFSDGNIVCSREALSGPDIWIDPRLYGSLFLSDRLVSALAEAKVEEAFGGLGGLRRCRIL
ncbi:MAG TPA: hypothetical protein VFR18_17990 [Terriglobia bacterium]|nr:hypothetical protein [Terriglobia bacterium]